MDTDSLKAIYCRASDLELNTLFTQHLLARLTVLHQGYLVVEVWWEFSMDFLFTRFTLSPTICESVWSTFNICKQRCVKVNGEQDLESSATKKKRDHVVRIVLEPFCTIQFLNETQNIPFHDAAELIQVGASGRKT